MPDTPMFSPTGVLHKSGLNKFTEPVYIRSTVYDSV